MTDARRRSGSGLGTAVAGMSLIAATYGMARFGVGLFAPRLAAQRPDLAGVLGWAAAAQFTSYCLAAAVAARFADRRPRAAVLLAGATATAGCLGVAVASAPAAFVLAVFVGGMGGAFASPALVPIVDAVVTRRATATGQSLVNSGTAVGVIGAGLVAPVAASVGPAWVCMALVCAVTALATWYPVRARADLASPASPAALSAWRSLVLPGAAAVLAGAGSALVWTFGPLLVTGAGAVRPDRVGWLWIALGAGGVLGTLTGVLVERWGRRTGWCVCAAALALACAALALSTASGAAWAAYACMAVFGAGYMGLSGVLVLWARQVRPDAAGAGTSVLFIALATGQALGSAGFGLIQGTLSAAAVALVAAGLCALGGLVVLVPRSPRAA
ncbi:putative MFS family arabinose efflux permease [Saccharothrix coeruleofusca]|uniref:MFS transporter n=1 Tax=Saccharothrix coeruleofusca TaxID=33919 RepID=UPI001AE9CB6A|nr:MFS transporter [Saccharothrix coeruleofusca]MBP2338186.1 putative MFS family arabinose efflux permease [Saccharothrix coeruleofusca]